MIDLNGKSILVTGGTGSFGQKFVSEVLHKFPSIHRLVVFSRDELKQYEMSQRFPKSKYECMRYFIGDVRDPNRLTRAFEEVFQRDVPFLFVRDHSDLSFQGNKRWCHIG